MSDANIQSKMEGAWAKPLSGGAPRQLILFLHGVGADGNDLISLAHELAPHFPDAQFVSPNAPFAYDMAPFGRQWFSLQEYTAEKMLEGARAVEPILNQYIDDQLAMYNIDEANLALVGFSQGTMTALHTALRRDKPCAAVVGFSGALLGNDLLKREARSKPPVCLVHGTMDEVVPFGALALASQGLSAAGIEHEAHAVDHVGHGIDPQGMLHMIEFLKKHLSKKTQAAA